MNNLLSTIISKKDLKDFKEFITFLYNQENKFLLRNDILLAFLQYCTINKKSKAFHEKSSLTIFLRKVQEIIISQGYVAILHRYAIAKYNFYLFHNDEGYLEEISVPEYLDIKDSYISNTAWDETHLHIDYMPFYDYSPSIKDSRTIGNGIRFLNRYLCSHIFQNPDEWNNKLFEFIKLHKYQEKQLLVNGSIIKDSATFFKELEKMIEWLKSKKNDAPFSSVESKMESAGFEAGWGNTVGRMIETMQLLIDLINEPTDTLLEQFISRVPMPLISKIAIISPHGWFAQKNVLGKPDTGGQVIYILDQVRALEKYLIERIQLTGLDVKPKILVFTRLIPDAGDTTCNKAKEKIYETQNSWIIRIPFVDKDLNVIKHWISRFHIWPYLEKFSEDSSTMLLSEFQGRPDLIIGNYSDGNLVATLLSKKLDVIQCTIAHALEKTKYLFSDMYWEDMEHDYNFSLQFTADILSMNKSDFIITSTQQEIIGTEYSMGQYESYQFFSMPRLYQVESGINLFAPKFNVIHPGVNENIYFPYYETEKRIKNKTKKWEKQLFSDVSDDIYGRLDDPQKIPVFTMARFDKIKNITGLIEAFGMSKKLQKSCNLIFAAGTINIDQSQDAEERDEISKAYYLIDKYKLKGKVRWLPSIDKLDTGEVYRIIADYKGIFVQPAHFEAFGLTILEAMLSGLPTFGPKFGGPIEIIEDRVSGYLVNTSKPELIADDIEEFLDICNNDTEYWKMISENGITRVKESFNWKSYSETLINLTKLYGFWRYSVSGKGKVKMDKYSDFIYHFLLRERAKQIGQ